MASHKEVITKVTKQHGPRDLRAMCITVALRNIMSIMDVGELPFNTAKVILRAINNPAQLHEIESNCPQIAQEPEMGDIWARLMQKKFPRWETRGFQIQKDMSWFDTYCAVKNAHDRHNAEAISALKQQLTGLNKAKEDKQTHIITSTRALPPMEKATRRWGAGSSSSFNFAAGSRTAMTNGKSVLKRARREAKEIVKATALSTPTDKLRVAAGQIKRAPNSMVHEQRVAQNPALVIHAPRKKTQVTDKSGEMAKREARLLAIKNGFSSSSSTAPKVASRPAAASKPALDSGDDSHRASSKKRASPSGEDDDLFDEAPKKRLRTETRGRSQHASTSPPPKKTGTATATGAGRGLLSNKRGTNPSPTRKQVVEVVPVVPATPPLLKPAFPPKPPHNRLGLRSPSSFASADLAGAISPPSPYRPASSRLPTPTVVIKPPVRAGSRPRTPNKSSRTPTPSVSSPPSDAGSPPSPSPPASTRAAGKAAEKAADKVPQHHQQQQPLRLPKKKQVNIFMPAKKPPLGHVLFGDP